MSSRQAPELLRVAGLVAGYGAGPVVQGVDLEVRSGEIVALVGANGAGKSTLLGVLSGLVAPRSGSFSLRGRELAGARPEAIVRAGIVHVPQGRRLFADLTVRKNLLLGAYLRRDAEVNADLERVTRLFPELSDKLHRVAGTLSGGEQQMVAIGRGLMSRPKLLMLDELSLGLAPVVVDRLLAAIREVNAGGVAMLLVEQDVAIALETAHRGYVLETGRVALSGAAGELMENPEVRRAYLGV
jgi:ABC-type branched-subunit amino acid transport system ATPase component